MRVEEITDGKATITIDGDEMIEIMNVVQGKILNELRTIYSIAVYHKIALPLEAEIRREDAVGIVPGLYWKAPEKEGQDGDT